MEPMYFITSLVVEGEDPALVLEAKEVDKKPIYKKYNTKRGRHSTTISMINNQPIRFTTQILACKFLRKCYKDECPIVLGLILTQE